MSNRVYPEGFIKIPSLFRIPFLEKSHIPITTGTLKEGYEEVLEIFRYLQRDLPRKSNISERTFGTDTSQRAPILLLLLMDRELVVDIWGGYADKSCEWKWDGQTLATIFSCTKAFTAITVAVQVDRGQLQYSDTIAKYWPEFGSEGKEGITVLQALQHQAGLMYLRDKDGAKLALDFDRISDLNETDKWVENQKPIAPPGERSIYHAITFGWILDGLMRRVDVRKRSVREFLREEITEPRGLDDVRIGNTRDVYYRLARIRSHAHNKLMAVMEWLHNPMKISKGAQLYYQSSSTMRKMLYNLNGTNDYEIFNNPALRTVGQPAMNGISNARTLAQILDIFEGGQLCSQPILDNLREPLIVDEYDSGSGEKMSKGHGFIYTKSPLGDWQYGHPGVGGQNMRTDTKRRITFAYITNGMKAGQTDHTRTMKRLEAVLYRCYQKTHAADKGEKLKM